MAVISRFSRLKRAIDTVRAVRQFPEGWEPTTKMRGRMNIRRGKSDVVTLVLWV
jgi:hypothetical protein